MDENELKKHFSFLLFPFLFEHYISYKSMHYSMEKYVQL